MIVLQVLRVLYGLSWVILFGMFVWMFMLPVPPYAIETVCIAFYYLGAYWIIRGIGRLCGYGRPAVPEVLDPESPVRIRRVILEEVSPYDQTRRLVHEDVTPYDERTDHAR